LMDGKTNLLFLGRLEKRKGLKYALSAYSKLRWDWPELRLIVVGPGKPDDDSFRIMSERNLTDVVFAGKVSDQDVARYFKSAHIFCSPATGKESFGIVLLEAMAAGVPVVATEIEGYASVVDHGVNGLLVPPKDDDQLADAIASLLRDPDLRARLSSNGLDRADEFRWERVAGRVMDYYHQFLDDPKAALPQTLLR
ncbi:MAG: glycosyltransferase family 4 protein, partial [SAR202 cluster bacterium]|nr:glycosyltransferase family 4 protein [SAR202 cluster bacterium]